MQTAIYVSSHRQWSRPLSERANLSDENLKYRNVSLEAWGKLAQEDFWFKQVLRSYFRLLHNVIASKIKYPLALLRK